MRRHPFGIRSDKSAAVAPTVALSIFALIGAGGIAFDYARMASLDTELQNAADQAALAAATQLDGQADACERAVAAAQNMVANQTVMGNDNLGLPVTIADSGVCDADTGITDDPDASVRFFQNAAKTVVADDDSNAKFVEVRVDPREARYALTPIVAAFSSGQLTALALAGLGESICRVPPVMMCNPDEANDPDFTISDYVGKGIRLIANDGGGNYGPGVFGFLDVAVDVNGGGANILRQILGRNGGPGDCVNATGVDIEPGNMIAVRDALNTRFDIYDGGLNQACGATGTLCPPSINSRKDLLKGTGGGQNSCGFQTGNGNVGWKVVDDSMAYLPTTNAPLSEAAINALAPMGYPRDICHSISIQGVCTHAGVTPSLIGNGTWDRYAYFRSHRALNYVSEGASQTAMNTFLTNQFGTTTPSRYQVYEYEMDHPATRLQLETTPSAQRRAYGGPVCSTPGITPSETQIDRRVLTVAVLNCEAEDVGPNSTEVPVQKWIDIFLVEPVVARQRTENGDVYVEVIGETENSTNGGAIQVVKKSVPYLIE